MATTTPTYDDSGYLGANPNVTRLYDNVQAVVQGVDLPLIKMCAWNAIEDYCLRSTVKRELVNWTMPIGVSTIDFNPFDESWAVAWLMDISGLIHYVVRPPGMLIDVDNPGAIRSGMALLALTPIEFGVDYPIYFWRHAFQSILSGTLARLYQMPNRPWSDPKMMELHWRRLNSGIAAGYAEAEMGFTGRGSRWMYPYFAAGHRKQ